jgi:hypothetical protein
MKEEENCICKADLPGSILEQVFKINGDQTITMPWYVGPIRGLREQASMQVLAS